MSPTADYSSLVASIPEGQRLQSYQWLKNGQPIATGQNPQLFLLHADGTTQSSEGVRPSAASGVVYDTGKFLKGIYLQTGGQLTYSAANTLNVSEGTVEMWVAPRYNGNDPIFSVADYVLFRYVAANGDYLLIRDNASAHIMHAAAVVNGQYESAYQAGGDTSGWKAGEWHHVAATFSATANHIRIYLDGNKIADNNEGHYFPPSAAGGSLYLGTTTFTIDEVRISNRELTASEIANDSARTSPFLNGETILATSQLTPGDSVVFSFGASGAPICSSSAYLYLGAPITNVSPASGLFPSGTATVSMSFNTPVATQCGYSVGSPESYSAMNALDGKPSLTHSATVAGLSADPRVVNHVYLRCASSPDYLIESVYRSVAPPTQPFPRIGNIFGTGDYLYQRNSAQAHKVQLFQGIYPATAIALRASSPAILLGTINVTDNSGGFAVPNDFFLKDTNGNEIQSWCAASPNYWINLTKPEVVNFLVQRGYQLLAQSGFAFDGIFVDNFGAPLPNP